MRKGLLAIGIAAMIIGVISIVAALTVVTMTETWFGTTITSPNVYLLFFGVGLLIAGFLFAIFGAAMRPPGAPPPKPIKKVAPAKREGEIEVLELLKNSFKSLIAEPGFILLYLLPFAVGLVLLAHIWLTYGTLTFSFSVTIRSFSEFVELVKPVLIWVIIYGLAFLMTTLTATTAIISKAGARARGERMGVGGALAEGIGRVPMLFAALVLVGAIVMGPILLLIALAILLSPSILLVVPLLLAILWFIPAIYMGVRLSLLAPACVLEDWGPVECLKECWRTTKGNFWLIFVVGLLLGFAFMIISMILTVPLLPLMLITPMVFFIGFLIAALLVWPAGLVAYTYLYLELKKRARFWFTLTTA